MREIPCIFEWLAEAEISQFEHSIVEKDVAGLDVPVHDVEPDQDLECPEEISQVGQCFLLSEASLGLDLLFECPSIAILINEVVVVGSFEYLYEAYDVSGVFDLGEGLYFIDGELFEFGAEFELFHFDDLDGHHLACLFVYCLVDLPEFALSDYCV